MEVLKTEWNEEYFRPNVDVLKFAIERLDIYIIL